MHDNEPGLPECVTDHPASLLFTPTAGMRLAPEVLVWEFMREVAYADIRETKISSRARDYKEAWGEIPEAEQVLLTACRGREKKGKKSSEVFYAPAYPSLARYTWYRKQTDRAIRNFLLGGALAHFEERFRGDGLNTERRVANALLGHRSPAAPDATRGSEILALLAPGRDEREPGAIGEIYRNATSHRVSAPLAAHSDILAETIGHDLLAICDAESRLPRREWIFLLTCYLRISTAMWLLAHLRITVMVRDWLLAACDSRKVPTRDEILAALKSRNEGLLHPTETPTREVREHVEMYMTARVEVSLLLRWLMDLVPERFSHPTTGLPLCLVVDSASRDCITIEDVLHLARVNSGALKGEYEDTRQRLTRAAEPFHAWRDPLKRGQGKNFDEFLRVLYRAPNDDSDSGLLIPNRGGTFSIVPAHRLLQVFAFLATARKRRERNAQDRGKLVLRDIEMHLYNYGIDFKSSSYGRPLLLGKLSEGGLLVGSPDAGESAEVISTLEEG